MVVFRKRRINKLIDQHAAAGRAERARLHPEIRDLMAEGRSDAFRYGDEREYCEYSLWLGQLFAESSDPSDALRPLACAYLTACLGGSSFKKLRSEAAEGLALAYLRFGEFELAAECLIDILQFEGSFSTLDPILVFSLLAEVHPQSDKSAVGQFYAIQREECAGLPDDHPIKAMAAVIDHRFDIVEHDYASLAKLTAPLLAERDETSAPAHRALAEIALREGRHREALDHAAQAVEYVPAVDGFPWMRTALTGLHARMLLAAGQLDEALERALQAWSATLPTLLSCKDDFARDRLRWMANECIDVAMAVACERRDWNLLTDFIENSRLQIARAAAPDRDDQVVREFPEALVLNSLKALGLGASRAALHAMGADWKIGKRFQVATTWRGRSEVISAVSAQGLNTDTLTTVDAHALLDEDLADGVLAWFAAVRGNVLFWTLTDRTGTVDGGSVDLTQPAMAASLAALRSRVQKHAQPDDPRDVRPDPDHGIDVAEALTTTGDPYEEELLAPLSALLPQRLRQFALECTPEAPLQVLFTLPAALSAVPWAVVPLGDGVRLVERIELRVLTPSAIRMGAPRPVRKPAAHPVVVSCANPDGALRKAPPVPAETVLDGNADDRVTLARFEAAVRANRRGEAATLFVRSHLGSSSGAPYIADRGILFSDGVLSARDLAMTTPGGEPRTALPTRTVLALCSGSSAGDSSGLALGLAAACRLAGSAEVVTSLFDVPDTSWGCNFDHRLAEAVSRPEPAASALRRLQLDCLHEWRHTDVDDTTKWDQLPHPLIWASFVVVY